jgi:hypothetical protein
MVKIIEHINIARVPLRAVPSREMDDLRVVLNVATLIFLNQAIALGVVVAFFSGGELLVDELPASLDIGVKPIPGSGSRGFGEKGDGIDFWIHDILRD